MATQSSSIGSKTANNPCFIQVQPDAAAASRRPSSRLAKSQGLRPQWSPGHRHLHAIARGISKPSPAIIHIYLALRNLDEEREKGRARMARHREKILEQGEQAEEFRARAREASRRFRQKNAKNLAHRQRILRLEAYGKKHRPRAWLERRKLLDECRADAEAVAEYCRIEADLDAAYGPNREKAWVWPGEAAVKNCVSEGNTASRPGGFHTAISWGGSRHEVKPKVFHGFPVVLRDLLEFSAVEGREIKGECVERNGLTTQCKTCRTMRHSRGHENPQAFCAQGKKIYVVTNGTTCGIFSSEARARKQVEGVSRGRWRAAKSWDAAVGLWNKACDAFHEDGCPNPASAAPSAPTSTRQQMQAITITPLQAATGSPRQTIFSTGEPDIHCKVRKISAFEAGFRMGEASAARSPPSSPMRATSRSPKKARAPASPLDLMDPVEAFSRMGVEDPCAAVRPPKQWAIAGVNQFFAERIDTIDHILTQHLGQADLKSSRNVKKLRAFIRRQPYIRKADDPYSSGDE
ncbi:hypothetical protein DFH08DRAFT_801806 [Mycena albidolilacea]|uniref:Uncharacterized protein n=1 Tax=Mycena albidolilacea TaxID=1033008 RepID=A0AAD7AH96_9AGAR|nr:hypothetical protein DFH08DRAFT_801806 [Mycena albidolilacea]